MPVIFPYIPRTITVHLGAPDAPAENVTVTFPRYIKGVAASEIYPTWNESAIRANVLAQISVALNRVYTEFYRSRGYDFDITSSTAIDQKFINGRNYFTSVERIVDEIFNDYLRQQGFVEPLAAKFCNGTTVTCNGMSQWGSVDLARAGYTPYRILTAYYGSDLELVRNAPVGTVQNTAPTSPLRLGSANNDVRLLQIRLNRISNNYPNIPKIPYVNGIFADATENAVREFQKTFNLAQDGIVGSATWFAVERIYAAVKRLNSLESEGLTFNEVSNQFPGVLRRGDANTGVSLLQYYLDFLSVYYDGIPSIAVDGIFGEDTENAVYAAQSVFGLSVDGLVGEQTWETIVDAYLGIVETIPVRYTEGNTIPFQGTILREGDESEVVRVLQEYLNYIAACIPEVPSTSPTGYFGSRTRASVEAIQRAYGLPVTGYVNAITWRYITDLYSDLYVGNRLNQGQYPGFTVG